MIINWLLAIFAFGVNELSSLPSSIPLGILLAIGLASGPAIAQSDRFEHPETWKVRKDCKQPTRDQILKKALQELELRSPGFVLSDKMISRGKNHWAVTLLMKPDYFGNYYSFLYDLCGDLRFAEPGK